MERDKSFLIRVLIAIGLVYAGWSYVVRPAKEKLDVLKQDRETQVQLIAQSGADFKSRLDETSKAHEMVHRAGDEILSVLTEGEEAKSIRELISVHARDFHVGINRIEPLRLIEFANTAPKNRYSDDDKESKDVRFIGETILVELDGTFPNIAGFLHQLGMQSKTIKLETFRMIPGENGKARMVAQLVKYELVDVPAEIALNNMANAILEPGE